jgi:organic anion transporter 5A
MDEWMDGRTNGWSYSLAPEMKDGWMVGWLDGWMDGWMDGWLNEWMVG